MQADSLLLRGWLKVEDSSFGSCFAAAILVYQTVVVVKAVVHGTDGIEGGVTVRILHNDATRV